MDQDPISAAVGLGIQDHGDSSMSVRSGGSTGARSPPSLSPVMTSACGPVSPSSPPPPLLTHAPTSLSGGPFPGPSPPGGHSPPMFPSPPPTSRPSCPPFLPALYFSHAYNSPPPIHTSDPTANDCKLIDYRGQKIAAFIISSETMLCLPQAFELFLKNLVGGLHTVYTKLKRLGIEPIVCNVEQVRVLRGLGAIQPGVNRCKLLSMKHFDVLYKDCTTASNARRPTYQPVIFMNVPGRPPKRPHEILGVGGFPPPMGHGGLPPPHLSPEALMALKKTRMDPRDFPPFMNGAISHMQGDGELEKSPLLNNGYNPPPKSLMAQYMALNGGMPHPALLAHTAGLPLPPNPAPWTTQHQPDHPFKPQPHPENIARSMVWENCRASYDEVLKHLERIREDRNRADRVLGLDRDDQQERPMSPQHHHKTNGYGEPDVLNLSSKSDSRDDLSDAPTPRDDRDDKDDNLSDADDMDDKNDLSDREDFDYPCGPLQSMYNNNNTSTANNNNSSSGGVIGSLLGSFSSSSGVTPTVASITIASNLQREEDRLPTGLGGLGGSAEGSSHPPLSSLENLLGNIQNLLKVAAESVRHEEKNWIREKEHLRLEFMRQKEMRERLEKQLMEDEKVKLLYLRKLKKEKRARRRLEEELTEKLKRLSQYEPNAKELLRAAAESLAKEGAKTNNVNTAIAAAAAAAAAAVSNASGGGASSAGGPGAAGGGGPTAGDSRTGGPCQDAANQHQQRLSPKNNNNLHQQQDMDQRPQQQNDGPPGPGVYFNKSLLFNCTA
ncbi:unnamed protein product, partial [Meganyctiphanes norvegica]